MYPTDGTIEFASLITYNNDHLGRCSVNYTEIYAFVFFSIKFIEGGKINDFTLAFCTKKLFLLTISIQSS